MILDFNNLPLYCNSLSEYSRFQTREINIGQIPLGADNPIRIQSMTNTNTLDTLATVEQAIRMINAGCEYVRITTPSIAEAENLPVIKQELAKRGYRNPLIADVHFNPKVAEISAKTAQKIRINPGNFSDKNIGKSTFSESEYMYGIEKIKENITPLINICKEYETAMRIGVNHGSLSERTVSKYGDTPEGMVASAMEFLQICDELNYFNIVLSMKASNPVVMVHAYRLLVSMMKKHGYNYPLHLGVTEAGEGMDGRIRSAAGIGALLEDGIGDTIRVSLTEAPENEIPVAKTIVNRYAERINSTKIDADKQLLFSPYKYKKNETNKVLNIGSQNPPVVIIDYSNRLIIRDEDMEAIGYSRNDSGWEKGEIAAEYIFFSSRKPAFDYPSKLGIIVGSKNENFGGNIYPVLKLDQYIKQGSNTNRINFITIADSKIIESEVIKVKNDNSIVFIIRSEKPSGIADIRNACIRLKELGCNAPVVLLINSREERFETFALDSASDAGALLIDGFGDGLFLNLKSKLANKEGDIIRTAFSILQATRTRISKPEYISCPTCGRTSFNIEDAVKEVKVKTSHLKGLKIGVMGCVVNGPGEMADADYGYVGAGKGKVNLYYKGELTKKNIPEEQAVEELLALIKENGDWK